jgi:hypothetical protein
VETADKQRTKLQIKHNGEPLKCKQLKKRMALRHVDDAPYEAEEELYIIKNFNDFKTNLKGATGNMQQLYI